MIHSDTAARALSCGVRLVIVNNSSFRTRKEEAGGTIRHLTKKHFN